MKRREDNDLLNDVLSEGIPSDFRSASLQRTLSAARQKRLRRRLGRVGSAIALFVGLMLIPIFRDSFIEHQKREVTVAVAPSLPKPVARFVPGTDIRLVTDEEVIAMFPNRPIALIGPPNERQIVFLDEQRKNDRRPMPN